MSEIKEDLSLLEVREWKVKVMEETQHLSNAEIIEYFNQLTKERQSNYHDASIQPYIHYSK